MFGKKVKIMTDIAGQEGMIGTVTMQGMDSKSKKKIYRVSIEPGQKGPQESINYLEDEIQDLSIDVKTELEKTMESPENDEYEKLKIGFDDFFLEKTADSKKAYKRRESTINHLEAWRQEINKNYSADMGHELEALYSEGLNVLKTIISIETINIAEGK